MECLENILRIRALKWKSTALIIFSMLSLFGTVLAVEYYKVPNVKRLDQNLYKSSGGLFIETKYCYHYTYGEDVILKWEGKYGDNMVIWNDDSTCDVANIWAK